jgi:hypothetical protein
MPSSSSDDDDFAAVLLLLLGPEEWPSSSLMGAIAAPIDAVVGCRRRAAVAQQVKL